MTDDFPSDPVPVTVATSDLPKRAASAIVMLAVAGAALWQGGAGLRVFIALVALGCAAEFAALVLRATRKPAYRAGAILAGALYIGIAAIMLARMRAVEAVAVIGAVICVDVFAYFFGRSIGGPKIAPRISPSKTWAGLAGGIVGASLWLVVAREVMAVPGLAAAGLSQWWQIVLLGAAIACAAQAGDFFESWLKRRAGKKDSSNLIPGHGGIFDRVDGLLPVALIVGLIVGRG